MNSISDADIPKVASISYGYLEDQLKIFYGSFLNSFNTEAMKLALRGVTILAASGDDGVANFQARDDPTLCGYNPSFPASNPYVTAVGGTQGRESSPSAPEVAAQCSVSGITTGGGFSEYWDMPDWQETDVEAYLNGSIGRTAVAGYGKLYNNGRGYPDISLAANSYVIYNGGNQWKVSGTSASSPVMAGLLTLVNEYRVRSGGTTLGFINPFLYRNASQYKVDVTSGHNRCTAATGCNNCCNAGFTADVGWDPVTGLGYLDYSNFFTVFTGVDMVTDIVIPSESDDDEFRFQLGFSSRNLGELVGFLIIIGGILFSALFCLHRYCNRSTSAPPSLGEPQPQPPQPYPVQQEVTLVSTVPVSQPSGVVEGRVVSEITS